MYIIPFSIDWITEEKKHKILLKCNIRFVLLYVSLNAVLSSAAEHIRQMQ